MAAAQWQTVAALVDPVRRALYEHVRRQDHPVTREEAADAIQISRNLTAFHLDKLVDAGLLRARYESPPDKQRGRGRTPKVYEVGETDLALTVPPRQYEMVGQILADAIAESPTDAGTAAQRLAFEYGRRLGRSVEATVPGPGTGERAAARAVLTELGFEPREGDDLLLGNCPFHVLAQRQTALVCGLNQALVNGLLDGLGARTLTASLQPQPGACCVRITSAPR